MFALPPRPPRQKIAQGSSARLSRLHLAGSRLGLNALGCDASDGVICGRAGLQRRLAGRGRKLSLPVMSRTEAAAAELGAGLAALAQKVPDQEAASPGLEMLCFGAPPAGGATCASEPISRCSPPLEEAASEPPVPLSSDTDWQEWRASAADDVTPPAGASSQADDVTPVGDDAVAAADTGSVSNKKLFAANLPFSASKARVRELFEQFGPVSSVHIVKNPTNGKPRGFGFVTFKEACSADNCLAADLSPRLYLHKRQIRVSPAQPRKPGYVRSRQRDAAAGFEPTGPCHADRLPTELLLQIFSYLTIAQQLELQRVSRRWQQAVRSLLGRRRRLDLDDYMSAWPGRRLTDGLLRQLLKLMPALRHLRTGGHARSCTWKALEIVASHCRHLVDIDLDGFCINEASLKKLCVACPDLETVQLPHHYHFSESSVWVLVRHLPRLRVLDLNRSERVTGRCFSLLPDSLQRLQLAGCTGLQSSALLHLQRCPLLTELDVSGVGSLQQGDLRAALESCPLLARLTVRRLVHALERCLPEQGMPQLRLLDAGFSDGVSDNTLRLLPHLLPALDTLNLQGCPMVYEEGLLQLHHLHQLRSLDLSYISTVTDSVLRRLGGPQLQELHLAEGFSGPAQFTRDGVTRAVLDHPALTLLNLSGAQLLQENLLTQLTSQLTAERDVTVYVGGTEAQDLCDPETGTWGAPPLRAKDNNTVPLHMRGYVDDDYGDSEDYDSDDFDFMEEVVGAYGGGMFDLDYDDEDSLYDAGYDDEIDGMGYAIWRWNYEFKD